jgi:hypothetical protein
LVASKLEEPVEPSEEIPEVVDQEPQEQDGTIEIDHSDEPTPPVPTEPEEPEDDIHIDNDGSLKQVAELLKEQEELRKQAEEAASQVSPEPAQPTLPDDQAPKGPGMVLDPPKLGGQLTANSVPEHEQYGGTTDPMSSVEQSRPTLSHAQPSQPPADKTLSDIEESLKKAQAGEEMTAPSDQQYPDAEAITPPVPAESGDKVSSVLADLAKDETGGDVPPPPPEDYARDAVERAVNASDSYRDEPVQSLGANPLGLELHENNEDEQKEAPKSDGPPPPPVPPPLPPQ